MMLLMSISTTSDLQFTCRGHTGDIPASLSAFTCFYYCLSGFVSQKTVYLFVYNLVQFLGFSWIFVNMTVRLVIFGQGENTSCFPR